jgi:alkylation response protein AidB-like acyl-CoA dehydrogenase
LRFPLTGEEEAFRAEVRDFCARNLPRALAGKVEAGVDLEREDYVGWQKLLADGGLLCGAWARPYGGKGWSALQSYLFDEECSLAGAPWLLPFGVNYVGPVICEFGSDEQKRRYLPGILDAGTFWCQGYSEPDAGSDLASLKTKAVRDGDVYVVNGRKIWTTMAHWADRIFCLVRTRAEGKPQAGISFLLIDCRAPGVTVRPIISIEDRHHLNEVIFEDVRVPVADRVGEENGGWTIAKFLLGNERLLVAEIGKQKRTLRLIRESLDHLADGGTPLGRAPWVRERLAELDARLLALEWTALRTVRAADNGGQVPAGGGSSPVAVSMLKIRGSELEQALTEFAFEVMGPLGLRYDQQLKLGDATPAEVKRNGVVARLLAARAATIYGGSNEVQRNIIGRSLLGM